MLIALIASVGMLVVVTWAMAARRQEGSTRTARPVLYWAFIAVLAVIGVGSLVWLFVVRPDAQSSPFVGVRVALIGLLVLAVYVSRRIGPS